VRIEKTLTYRHVGRRRGGSHSDETVPVLFFYSFRQRTRKRLGRKRGQESGCGRKRTNVRGGSWLPSCKPKGGGEPQAVFALFMMGQADGGEHGWRR